VLVLDERNQIKPAQLLWQGPQQVKLGTQFTVALRVTSAQPVRASPMQINVNSALFETVSVKPGRFFEDREQSFNYRIDPGGTIFVGASSIKPAPAADAEFVVLTLKPLKPDPAAELAIASLSLHGAAGRVIQFDLPATFKTSITN
jgi:Cohesin domain